MPQGVPHGAAAMARDEQRMFRIHDAPKPAITPADFQRMLLKKAKAQALARALQSARQQQPLAEQQQQQLLQPQLLNTDDQRAAMGHDAGCEPSQAAEVDAQAPQPMAIDGAADPSADCDEPAAEQRQSPAERQQQQQQTPTRHDNSGAAQQPAANARKAKQQEEAHAAALRRQLIQSRKEALSRRRHEEYEAEEARKHR